MAGSPTDSAFFSVGKRFNSFADLQERLSVYESSTYTKLWRRDSRSVEAARKRINRPFLTQLHTTRSRIAAFTEAKNSLPVEKESGLHRKCSLSVSNCLGIQGPTLFHGDGSNCGPRLKYCTYSSLR